MMRADFSTGTTLAPALWPTAVHPVVRGIVLVLIGTALLTLSAKIKVPFWPVPMTLQTFAIMLIAASYGRWLAVATVLAYLTEGLVGLPVFTNTPPAVAGLSYFLGSTGGFLIGFVGAAYIVGWAADRGWDRSALRLAGAMLVGDAIVFALGFAWLAWFAELSSGAIGAGTANAWVWGVKDFLLADAVKIALAAALLPVGWAFLKRNNRI